MAPSLVLMPLLLALHALRVLGALLAMPTALFASPTRRVSLVFLLVDALVALLASLAPPTPPQMLVMLTALLAPSLFQLPLSLTTSLLACMLLPVAMVPFLSITFLTPSVSLLVRWVMLSVLATPAVSLVVFAPPVIARLVVRGISFPLARVSRTRLADSLRTLAQACCLPSPPPPLVLLPLVLLHQRFLLPAVLLM